MTEHRIDLKKLETIRDGSGHSIFGASGAPMFLRCTGSLIPNLLAPDDAGEDAAYGTVAHALGEQWRKTGVKPVHMIGKKKFVPSGEWGFMIEIDETMLDYVQMSVDWSSLLPGDHIVEVRVDYSDLTPIKKQGGTLDFGALRRRIAVIQDEKYGKSEEISAEEHYQLMLYAYGVYREWDWFYGFKEFVIRISQPRLDNFDEWKISVADLLEFAEWAKGRMHEAWTPNAPRTPGHKQCKWCKVKSSCAAAAKMENDLVTEAFAGIRSYDEEDIEQFKSELDIGMLSRPLDVMTLSLEQMANLKMYRKFSESFWNALDKELMRRAIVMQEKIPGMKLVNGRSSRKFVSKAQALKALVGLGCDRKDVLVEELVSPSQAENLLRKAGHRHKDLPELLAGLVEKSPGKPTLVPLSDRRSEIKDITEDAFAALSEEPDETD